MATRKIREILRRRRVEFDRQVEENRKKKALDGLTKAELIEYAEKKGALGKHHDFEKDKESRNLRSD